MAGLDDFLAQTSNMRHTGRGLDSFAKEFFPAVNSIERQEVTPAIGELPTDTTVQPGFLVNVAKDLRNKLGQWWQGAQAGGAEVLRAAKQYPVSMSSAEMPGGAGLTPEDRAAIDYNRQAVENFTNETVKPVAYTAGFIAPAVAAPFLVSDAAQIAKEKGPLEVVKEFTGYNTVAKAIENPKEFGRRFYEKPLTTAAELVPAALIGRAGYKGLRGKVREIKEGIEARAERGLDSFLKDLEPAEKAPAFTVKEGVDFGGLNAETQNRVRALIRDYNREFPDDTLTITDAMRPADAGYGSSTSYHKAGAAVDFASAGLEADPARRARLIELAREHGFIEVLDEYASPSEGATGGHVHIGGLGESRTVAGARQETRREAVQETESSAARLQELASEALDNEDFATAADLFEQMGSPKVAAQLRRAAMAKTEPEVRAMATPEVEQVGKFIDDTLADKKFKWMTYRDVTPEEVAVIKEKTGLDVTGYKHEITNEAARHILREHSNAALEKERGQLPVTVKDIASIPEIVRTADAITPGGLTKDGLQTVFYQKKVNGYAYLLETVQTGRQTLRVKSMWKTSSARVVPEGGPPQTSSSAGSPPAIPERSLTSSTSNIIDAAATVKSDIRPMAAPASTVSPSPAGRPIGPILRKQILDAVEDLFTKVWTGRINRQRVLGWFNTRTEAIRLKDYGDLQTVGHEVGHFLDETKLKLSDGAYAAEKLLPKAQRVLDAELQTLGARTSMKSYTKMQVRKEGVAEFMREYITDKATAEAKAPNFYRHFEGVLDSHPEIRASLDKLNGMVGRWYGQAPEARARSGVSFGYEEPKPSIIQRAKDTWMGVYEKIVDAKVGLADFVKRYEQAMGEKVAAESDPYKLARAAHTGATARAELLVEGAKPSLIRQTLNKFYNGILPHDVTMRSIIDKLNEAGKELDRTHPEYLKRGNFTDWREAFDTYIVARRQIEIQKTKPKYKGPMSPQDAAAMVRNAPKQFEAIAKDFYDYGDNLLRIAVDGGLVSRQLYNELKTKYQNYAAMARDFSDEAAGGGLFGAGRGFGNVRKVIKSLSKGGSTRTVVSPLESMIRNTYVTLNLVERNRVGQAFAKLAEKQGSGQFVEAVTGAGDANKSIFTVWINGERKAFQTTPEVYRAIMSLNEEGASFITKLLSAPASWLRAGATLSPEFIVKNLSRDAFSAAIYSKAGFVPGYDTIRGLAKVIGDEQAYLEYKASGAMRSTLTAVDRQTMVREIERFVKNKPNLNPLEILRAVNDLGESATRLAEFAKVREKGGSILEATLAAKDVTIDFSRAGSLGRGYNRITAFFNAGVQGVDRMARAFREDPLGTSGRIAMYITAPSVLLWLYAHDDVRYQELPAYQRDLFWCIPTGRKLTREEFDRLLKSGKSREQILAEAGPILRIPKPFEPGIIFGSGAERFLDWCMKNDRAGVKAWVKSARDGLVPNLLPTAAVPLIEWNDNYSQFLDRPVVPQREEKLPAKLQYGPNTSEVAKFIGRVTDTSPRKVENTIRGYTGGLGGVVLGGVDMVAGKDRPERRWFEQPVVRAAFASPFAAPESVKQFYDTLREQEAKLAEYRQTRVKPEGYEPALLSRLRTANETLQLIHQRERQVLSSNMSPETKRRELDKLTVIEVNAVRKVLGK
jgi:hypothetical protein